jgi:hypothetical protein
MISDELIGTAAFSAPTTVSPNNEVAKSSMRRDSHFETPNYLGFVPYAPEIVGPILMRPHRLTRLTLRCSGR